MMPGPDSRTDEQLIDACSAGDAPAFAELYRRHRDWAMRVAFRFTGDRDEALDIMQESFAYFLSKFPGFRLSPGARVTSFLYVVIKHNALAGRRKLRRRVYGVPETAARDKPDADGEVLAALVTQIADGPREVLLMRAVDGMSMQEIAVALSIPVGTVKSRLHNALAALRADPRAARYFGDQPGA
jgi:RNA polymerase sigma-70 factor, ECF subfamily